MTKVYNAPTLTKIGSFEEITKGNSTGELLDKAFPVTTPRGQLSFS